MPEPSQHLCGRQVLPSVLVVEDEPRVRASAVEFFEDLGATVYDAYHAAQALAILADHPDISLLFTDIRLPTVDGVELASMAVMRRPDLRVILTSGYGHRLAHPSWSFMPKPWSLSALREAVVAALATRPRSATAPSASRNPPAQGV